MLAVSKVAFNQAVDSVRAGGRVVAVGLPSGNDGPQHCENCIR